MGVESFRIAQIVDQIGELGGHFIGIPGRFILIPPPLFNIFSNELPFPHVGCFDEANRNFSQEPLILGLNINLKLGFLQQDLKNSC